MSSVTIFGQAPTVAEELVSVPKSMLSKEQLRQVEVNNIMENISNPEEYNSIMAYGRAVGVAISDGLSAVVDQADRFGSTNVGQFTMYIIAFKVIGAKLIAIVGGLFFWIFGMAILIYIRKKLVTPIRVVKVNEGLFKRKEYEILPSMLDEWYEKRNYRDSLNPIAVNTLLMGVLTLMCFIAVVLV